MPISLCLGHGVKILGAAWLVCEVISWGFLGQLVACQWAQWPGRPLSTFPNVTANTFHTLWTTQVSPGITPGTGKGCSNLW